MEKNWISVFWIPLFSGIASRVLHCRCSIVIGHLLLDGTPLSYQSLTWYPAGCLIQTCVDILQGVWSKIKQRGAVIQKRDASSPCHLRQRWDTLWVPFKGVPLENVPPEMGLKSHYFFVIICCQKWRFDRQRFLLSEACTECLCFDNNRSLSFLWGNMS